MALSLLSILAFATFAALAHSLRLPHAGLNRDQLPQKGKSPIEQHQFVHDMLTAN